MPPESIGIEGLCFLRGIPKTCGNPSSLPVLARAAIIQLEAETAMTTSRNSATSLSALREEAAYCRTCDLWKHATQTVFGEGPPHAQIMLVGEQPGDKEDLAGPPFVGPAGQMLGGAPLKPTGMAGLQHLGMRIGLSFSPRLFN